MLCPLKWCRLHRTSPGEWKPHAGLFLNINFEHERALPFLQMWVRFFPANCQVGQSFSKSHLHAMFAPSIASWSDLVSHCSAAMARCKTLLFSSLVLKLFLTTPLVGFVFLSLIMYIFLWDPTVVDKDASWDYQVNLLKFNSQQSQNLVLATDCIGIQNIIEYTAVQLKDSGNSRVLSTCPSVSKLDGCFAAEQDVQEEKEAPGSSNWLWCKAPNSWRTGGDVAKAGGTNQ